MHHIRGPASSMARAAAVGAQVSEGQAGARERDTDGVVYRPGETRGRSSGGLPASTASQPQGGGAWSTWACVPPPQTLTGRARYHTLGGPPRPPPGEHLDTTPPS